MQNHCEGEGVECFNKDACLDVSKISKTVNDDSISSVVSKPGRAERRIEEYLSKWSDNVKGEIDDQYQYYNPHWASKFLSKRNKSLKYKPKWKSFGKPQIFADYINSLNLKTFNQDRLNSKYNYGDIVNASGKINYENKILHHPKEISYFELLKENSQLKEELETRNLELSNLKPRLKFLEDNYEDFVFMKKEMKKLKKQKIRSGEILEKNDIGTQTWETAVICSQCITTSKLVDSPEYKTIVSLSEKGAIVISKIVWNELLTNFAHLRSLICEREKDYENRKEKLQIMKLREKITFLEDKLVKNLDFIGSK